jgi:beta-phosphoglucomutase-like phosphatase (HAD superfamily)
VQAVIFDLDGVLVNSMPTHFRACKAAFAKIAGLEIAERDVYRKGCAPVVENAPLGVKAANCAGISCYVVFNNTPLARPDFKGIIPEDRIFERTGMLREVLCR